MLPRNMNWCFSELNFYAQCNRFSLGFQQELQEHFDKSIEHQCDGEREYNMLTSLHRQMDLPYGPPDDLETPNETLTDWCGWAHAKSVNLG
eukprot:2530550-Amphidinium_carterae.1